MLSLLTTHCLKPWHTNKIKKGSCSKASRAARQREGETPPATPRLLTPSTDGTGGEGRRAKGRAPRRASKFRRRENRQWRNRNTAGTITAPPPPPGLWMDEATRFNKERIGKLLTYKKQQQRQQVSKLTCFVLGNSCNQEQNEKENSHTSKNAGRQAGCHIRMRIGTQHACIYASLRTANQSVSEAADKQSPERVHCPWRHSNQSGRRRLFPFVFKFFFFCAGALPTSPPRPVSPVHVRPSFLAFPFLPEFLSRILLLILSDERRHRERDSE
mmetsp:Transcript_25549/g.49979  ORF Transcript_25549/g.49979 Transcript_25549/m.49979 type:complete len:272 (-) Transcript_25549:587-1402(-)